MIRVSAEADTKEIAPGQIAVFNIATKDPDIETRAFLHHEGLRYMKPLCDWNTERTVSVFLQAPGRYRLEVEWRRAGKDEGRTTCPFTTVLPKGANRFGPSIFKLESKMWAPSKWEAEYFKCAEPVLMERVRSALQPGSVAYDLGANIGVYAALLTKAVGSSGHVFCIEANPVCLSLLRANLSLTGRENYTILPVAVSNADGELPFLIDYGNSNLGLSEVSGYFETKTGHEVTVHAEALDDLITRNGLRPPDFIKIDIEGAEAAALQGMTETLARHGPTLFMELHGARAGIPSIRLLEQTGYRVERADNGEPFLSSDELEACGANEVWHIFARPSS